jgi:predicted dehydrogenase
VIGGGLMGREAAAAIARWPALEDHPVRPVLAGVCDTDPARLAWFERIDTAACLATDHRELLAAEEIDVVYIAVPHHLHEQLYLDAVAAGKDLLAEKPFGIDLGAAERIVAAIERAGVFVRCSSEMPFFPGAQLAIAEIRSGALGRPLEAQASFMHSSDLDPRKPINWKRQTRYCGELGVMGDLGVHALHAPLRLGWLPRTVYAATQNIVRERPGPDGRPVPCDTIDNATLIAAVGDEERGFPLTVETKRIAPGETNTWILRAVGMNGGVEFSTRAPKTVRRFVFEDGRQAWQELQVGSQSVFPTVTGAIFEFGFADAILQMWAAFLAERAGALGAGFGCLTPQEALDAHRVFAAALRSSQSGRAEPIPAGRPPR